MWSTISSSRPIGIVDPQLQLKTPTACYYCIISSIFFIVLNDNSMEFTYDIQLRKKKFLHSLEDTSLIKRRINLLKISLLVAQALPLLINLLKLEKDKI
jgi:hypothetical protein